MPAEIIEVISPYVLVIVGALISMVTYMIKKLMERIHTIEEKQYDHITRVDAKAMVVEKLEPLDKRMDKIDYKLDKIIDMLLSK